MKKLVVLLLTLALLTALPCLAFTGKVIKVSDGDTIQVLDSGQAVKVRLAEIDCPETSHGPKKPGQPFGQAAKKFVLDLVGGKTVLVDVVTKDRYGRIVGKVFLDDGTTLNSRLVQAGLAWAYRRYANDPALFKLEAEARAAKRGLWSDPHPIPPWEWRHGAGWGKAKRTSQSSTVSSGRCGQKRYCREMVSCEEAMFYLNQCGLTRLDRDGDGIPCESICR
ncbi:endonuclease YncB(thermonuclease family) [Geothermobacter ehrlichii]|uniref:Endonuclease YncB(Thermonuclease family) n=1 Tax=Geothermobacter ehrlichii TaxID=213224 RepID=A0A5D3WKE4_9BACT|nr:thermonuclease family protein [Geothermobacter ehrlichii]TYO96773.1 endonuclease YncB(thermonuclease family) [Geothermobacter ehrlichii]